MAPKKTCQKAGNLLTVRKVMSVGTGFAYTRLHETPRPPRRARTPTPTRCPTRPRRVSGGRGRRVPRRLAPNGLAVARPVPRGRHRAADGSPRAGPTPQALHHAGEDRPAMAARRPHGARVPYPAVDGPPTGPAGPAGVRHPAQPEVSQRLAPGPRVHPPEAPAGGPRAGPGGDRGVAGHRL